MVIGSEWHAQNYAGTTSYAVPSFEYFSLNLDNFVEPKKMENRMAGKKISIEGMSLDQLKSHLKDVEKAIAEFAKRKKDEALKEIQAVAKKHGLSIDDIVAGKSKTRKSKAAAKYRNPENPSQEWSGRGRQPAWFKAAIAAGKKPESLEI